MLGASTAPAANGFYSALSPTTASGASPSSTTSGFPANAMVPAGPSLGGVTNGVVSTGYSPNPTPDTTPNPTSPTPATAATAAATPGVLSGPGYGEAWEAANGNNLSGPSNSQTLYDQGVNATNPYYANAMAVTTAGINSAEAARGEGNSGAALSEIGTADANLSGQQALGQSTLAGQADTANTSQFTAGSNAANNAENQTNNRVSGAASAYTNLSNDQAQMVDNFYQMAETGQMTGDMASIEAQLAASGVDAATAQAITNDLLSVAGTGVKAATSSK